MFTVHNFQRNKQLSWFFISILFVILLYVFYEFGYYKNQILKRGKFTVGYIEKVDYSRGGNTPFFRYSVNNKTYRSNESTLVQGRHQFDHSAVGSRYFVVFDSTNPNRCSLLPLNPVPDSIQIPKIDGWSKLPTMEVLNR